AQLHEKLGHHSVKMQVPIGAEDRFLGVIDPIADRAYYFEGEGGVTVREAEVPAEYREATDARLQEIIEKVADVDDDLAEIYLSGEAPTPEQLHAAIRRATIALKMTPVFCGSAYKNKGVQKL